MSITLHVDDRGGIELPLEVRQRLGVEPGSALQAEETPKGLLLKSQPARPTGLGASLLAEFDRILAAVPEEEHAKFRWMARSNTTIAFMERENTIGEKVTRFRIISAFVFGRSKHASKSVSVGQLTTCPLDACSMPYTLLHIAYGVRHDYVWLGAARMAKGT